MKTCKNCIHNGVCGQYLLPFERDCVEEHCEYFKDKSKFIELPCPIGSTVYMIVNIHDTFDDSEYRAVIQVSFRLDMLNNFNKRFFLTREEAEKKLEELNGQI